MNFQKRQIKTNMLLKINPMICNLSKDTTVEGKSTLEDVLTKLQRAMLVLTQMNVIKGSAQKVH